MQLPHDQVERFYAIWMPLMLFVNRRLKLVPEMLPKTFDGPWDISKVKTIRDALWDDDSLLEGFIAENPANLPEADLALVDSWRQRRKGKFFALRHLKKYTLFLEDKEKTIYGVVGLASPMNEVIPFVPCYIEAVLLPFEDAIIYDSLLIPFNITFGSGIRRSLDQTYRDIKERGAIVTLLSSKPVDRHENAEAAHATDERVLEAFRAHLYASRLTAKVVERDLANVNAFAENYLLQLPEPRSLRDFGSEQIEGFLSHRESSDAGASGRRQMRTSLGRFLRFLRDTERMDYHESQDALKSLKDKS